MHQNVNSIRNKIETFEIFLESECIDVFCLTEHHLPVDQCNSIHLKNYKLKSIFCRSDKSCGGSAIFCRNSLLDSVKELDII